uniref:Uncharacterized protein n=1 Tax=Anguilla anguilla TaxID=7936 RepID=A0A0E9WPB2_ANGAN
MIYIIYFWQVYCLHSSVSDGTSPQTLFLNQTSRVSTLGRHNPSLNCQLTSF